MRYQNNSNQIALATATAALPFPPTTNTAGVGRWGDGKRSVPGKFILSMWADGAASLTDAELYAGRQAAGTITDDDVDAVVFASNQLTITGHALQTGDGPFQFTTTDTLPTGIELATDYWAIVIDANTIQIAASLDDALNGTAVAFSDGGTGTHTLSDTADTMLMQWRSLGLLGPGQYGSISLTAVLGYEVQVEHTPGVVGYSVYAAVSANNVSVALQALNEAA